MSMKMTGLLSTLSLAQGHAQTGTADGQNGGATRTVGVKLTTLEMVGIHMRITDKPPVLNCRSILEIHGITLTTMVISITDPNRGCLIQDLQTLTGLITEE